MPSYEISINNEEWNNYTIANPTFNQPGPIDIILGAEYYTEIIKKGLYKSSSGILGRNTEFGWILSGNKYVNHNENIKV